MDVKSILLRIVDSRILDLLLDLCIVPIEGDIERLTAAEVIVALLANWRHV